MRNAAYLLLFLATQAMAWQTPQIYKIGNGVSPPKVEHKVDPKYTKEARAAKVAGIVSLNLVIDANGSPRDIVVTRGLGFGLDEAAVDCVQKWRFKPGMKEGSPVNVQATIDVNFRLVDRR